MALSSSDLSIIDKWLTAMVREVTTLKDEGRAPTDEDIEELEKNASRIRQRLRRRVDESAAGGAVAERAPAGPAGDAPDESNSFADFFREIGEGLLETQQELDRRTDRYLQSIRNRPHLLPSVFRVPEVSGRLKVGLHQQKDRKLNFIVFGSSTSAKKWAEHEIDFKMAAVPPPPEALGALRSLPGTLTLVLSAAERAEVFAAVSRCLDEADPGGGFFPGAFPAGILGQSRRALAGAGAGTLIWMTGDRSFLIVAGYELANGTRCHGAWRLDAPDPDADAAGPLALTALWRVTESQRATEFAVVDPYLDSTYASQRRLLEGLPAPPEDG